MVFENILFKVILKCPKSRIYNNTLLKDKRLVRLRIQHIFLGFNCIRRIHITYITVYLQCCMFYFSVSEDIFLNSIIDKIL